jgi:plastocyanin
MRGKPKATLVLTETERDELLALLSPDTLTVKRGDTAVWVNKDPFPHTVTAVDRRVRFEVDRRRQELEVRREKARGVSIHLHVSFHDESCVEGMIALAP